ncbi:DUF6493 family protein [Planomonospora corallina]|uniref:DUF6493 family protein n=1 Tax=Planomonospora corallina TaxID=1806052 RepID=A0ABV8I7D6_9ACTN
MNLWGRLLARITAGDADGAAELLERTDERDRHAVAGRPRAYVLDGEEARDRAHLLSTWYPAAALAEDAGVEPPDGDAFVLGWVQAVAPAGRSVTGDGLARHLSSRLPRTRDLTSVLRPVTEAAPAWAATMARLADEGVLERPALLGGCVEAFLAGKSRPFTDLYAALRPDPAELPVEDLVRLLPAAPGPVVRLAAQELRRADGAGLLGDDLFLDAAGALAFRPEKAHVRAALGWAEAAVRREPRRADDALRAVTAALGHAARDVRERAVRSALALARHAGEPGRAAVRAAADDLAAALRDRLAPAFRLEERPAPEPARLPVFTPESGPLHPVRSAEELAGLAATARDPLEIERLVAGLVELVHRDREAVRAAVGPWLREHWPSLLDEEAEHHGIGGMDDSPRLLAVRAVLAAAAPRAARRLRESLDSYPLDGEPARRVLAAWIARGGLADPVVGLRTGRLPLYGGSDRTVTRISPTVWPQESDLPDLARRLCMLDPPYGVSTASRLTEWWPLVMPSHREVITAWTLPRLPAPVTSRRADLVLLHRLACGQGPVGAVSAAALAHGLGYEDDGARGTAVGALLLHAARGDLDGRELGRSLAVLVAGDVVRPGRVAAALGDAVAAGAHAEVWAAIAEMLPALLPDGPERPRTGLADLLAVGTEAAAAAGARAGIPELAVVARRGGSSRLVREARRLLERIGAAPPPP